MQITDGDADESDFCLETSIPTLVEGTPAAPLERSSNVGAFAYHATMFAPFCFIAYLGSAFFFVLVDATTIQFCPAGLWLLLWHSLLEW